MDASGRLRPPKEIERGAMPSQETHGRFGARKRRTVAV